MEAMQQCNGNNGVMQSKQWSNERVQLHYAVSATHAMCWYSYRRTVPTISSTIIILASLTAPIKLIITDAQIHNRTTKFDSQVADLLVRSLCRLMPIADWKTAAPERSVCSPPPL